MGLSSLFPVRGFGDRLWGCLIEEGLLVEAQTILSFILPHLHTNA